MAPSYANIFMNILQQNVLWNYNLKIFDIYIDIFLIWTHGKDSLHDFKQYLNRLHNTIKFTVEYSVPSNIFWDVLVHFNNNYISTFIHSKHTGSHSYLNFNSCHLKDLKKKKSIMYSQCFALNVMFWPWGLQKKTQKAFYQSFPKEKLSSQSN